ncbi:unnamed protein product [Paramecium sonneborni]|uniref:Uncharacterized protein n=1 Tax=Paramecium sonneborni TaxID=65129 RepID=A0A8S1RTF6_9CILI|nr:unnamed protein product [Paramecium sonneborni]
MSCQQSTNWVEQRSEEDFDLSNSDEEFFNNQGENSKNKNKNGGWNAIWNKQPLKDFGGYYKAGKKQGLWKYLFPNYSNQEKIFEIGEYNNGLKIGRWKYIYKNQKIGGGFFNIDGQKIGKWIDLDEGFQASKKVIFCGEYDQKSIKVGRWDIMYCGLQSNREYKQIGGGSYDQEGNQKKFGKWVELFEKFRDDAKVTYNGEYNNNNMKVGRWDIMYCDRGEEYKQIGGGSYDQEGNQKKFGKWVELFEKFRDDAKVIYNGEYNMNNMKIGRWDIMYCDRGEEYKQMQILWNLQETYLIIQKNIISGGGSYDEEGNQKKIGKWVELDQKFRHEMKVIHNGEYNNNNMKVGRWDIMYCDRGEEYKQMQILWNLQETYLIIQKNIISGGGSYDEEGNQKKIGRWIELYENFNHYFYQITYNGEYNMNSMKVGRWNVLNLNFANQIIGCMNFDEDGNEIYRTKKDDIIYVGSFKKQMKVGRWDILYRKSQEYKQIGGGSYDEEGNQKKIGKWVELFEKFRDDAQVTYNGEYNMNNVKVGRWNVLNLNFANQIIGCMNFDEDGNEIYRTKNDDIIYVGSFKKQMKVGRWDILYRKFQEYKQMQILWNLQEIYLNLQLYINSGGGSYDEEGNQKKIGKWVELFEKFRDDAQVTYNGEYNNNNMKVGRWGIYYWNIYGSEEFKYMQIFQNLQETYFIVQQNKNSGGGSYDEEGNQKKIGKWVELFEKFRDDAQVIYNGEYNLNNLKVGRWDIYYCNNYKSEEFKQMQILENLQETHLIVQQNKNSGGGSYDEEGNQKKIGKWVELDKRFCHAAQVIYNGEYNLNNMKVGRWDIYYCNESEGVEYKQMQILWNLQETYLIIQKNIISGGGSYDEEGNQKKIGKWIELDEKFSNSHQVTYSGQYNMNNKKVGRWDINYCNEYGGVQYQQMQILQNLQETYLIIQKNIISGGGSYDEEGNQKKIGRWIELYENFNHFNQIAYNGEYNMNSMKVDRWNVLNLNFANQIIGCMNFDEDGNEIYRTKNDDIIYVGSFKKQMKVGRWDILYRKSQKYKQMQILWNLQETYLILQQNIFSGGGSYDEEGHQKKIGNWVELDKRFCKDVQVIYNGEYNMNNMKVGRWDIYYCNNYKSEEFKQMQIFENLQETYLILQQNIFSGGGSYDEEGHQKKIGNWVELDKRFCKDVQVIYNGEYNMNNMKIGRWDIYYCNNYGSEEFKQMQIFDILNFTIKYKQWWWII